MVSVQQTAAAAYLVNQFSYQLKKLAVHQLHDANAYGLLSTQSLSADCGESCICIKTAD